MYLLHHREIKTDGLSNIGPLYKMVSVDKEPMYTRLYADVKDPPPEPSPTPKTATKEATETAAKDKTEPKTQTKAKRKSKAKSKSKTEEDKLITKETTNDHLATNGTKSKEATNK